MLDHGNLRHFIGDQEQMRKDRGIFVDQPVKNFDRQIEFDGAWYINESAGADLGSMQRREFGGAESGWLGHEMFPH